MQKYRLEKLLLNQHAQNEPLTSSRTILAGEDVCRKLKIQKSGFRLLKCFSNPLLKTLVKIEKHETLESNDLRASFSLIHNFGEDVLLERVNLAVTQINGQLYPLLPQAQQIYVFVHNSSKHVEIIKEIVKSERFIVSLEKQELFLDLTTLRNKTLTTLGSDANLNFRRLVAENRKGKFTNYLSINIKAISKEDNRYDHCLFVPNKTKITIQKGQHFELNQLTKIIHLPQIHSKIYATSPYKKLQKEILRQIDYKPQKKMILLKATSGLGISSLVHKISQQSSYNFIRINCKYFVNERQLLDKIKSCESFNATLVYIKNVEWLLEVGNDKNDNDQKMKRLLRSIEEVFSALGDHALTSLVLIINYQGHSIKLDMTRNSSLVAFELDKEDKTAIFKEVIELCERERDFQLADHQEVLNLTVNSIGCFTFYKILKRIPVTLGTQVKTEEVLSQLSKVVHLEKVESIKNVTWKDVGGLEHAKEEIMQTILLPTLVPEIFDENIKPRTGLLFFGPPGTGKTMLGKCIANECKMSFISVKGPQLLNMYIGQSEKNVRRVFERAAASKPCIIFMDELDALIPKRGQSSDSNQVMDRIVSELLTQMDRAPANGSFVIGATNRPDLLDPSILRPGRFDKQIYLGITKEKEARIQILRAQTRHINLQPNFDFERVIEQIPQNFTGADFYGLTSRSITKAAERLIQKLERSDDKQQDQNEEVLVEQKDFIEVAKEMKPSVSMDELKHYEKLREQYK